MGHAFTPGLRIEARTVIRKVRRLPIRGRVVVAVGELVEAERVVARAETPGPARVVAAADMLGVAPGQLPRMLRVAARDACRAGDLLAERRGWWGWMRREVRAPVEGVVEAVSDVAGQIVLRLPPRVVELAAHVPGRVVEVLDDEGVVIETPAALIQGTFGVGGEARGRLAMAVDRPDEVAAAARFDESHGGCVCVAGALALPEVISQAVRIGVVGLIVGGVHDVDLAAWLGREFGSGVTGNENAGLTLIVTEGFGRMPMAAATFELLRSLAGRMVCMDGTTQIRAGVQRPEVIVPLEGGDGAARAAAQPSWELEVGSRVRLIRAPLFGRLGRVVELPAEAEPIETEARMRVAVVRLDEGALVRVPRANVELVTM